MAGADPVRHGQRRAVHAESALDLVGALLPHRRRRGAATARLRADRDVRPGRVPRSASTWSPGSGSPTTRLGEALGEGTLLAARRRWSRPWRAGPLPAGAAQHDRAQAARGGRHPRPLAGRHVGPDPEELLRRRPRRHQPRTPPPRGRLGDGGPRRQPHRRRRAAGAPAWARSCTPPARGCWPPSPCWWRCSATPSTALPGRGNATRRWRGGTGCFQRPAGGPDGCVPRAGGPAVVRGHAGRCAG